MHPGRSIAALALFVAACNPSLNWREVRVDDGRLQVLLPCKPDHATRPVQLRGPSELPVDVNMAGCEADGQLFAVAHATLDSPAQAQAAMQLWKQATVLQAGGKAGAEQAWGLKHDAQDASPGVLSVVRGTSADGKPVSVQAAYFTRGPRLYQAVVIAAEVDPGAAQTFLDGLSPK